MVNNSARRSTIAARPDSTPQQSGPLRPSSVSCMANDSLTKTLWQKAKAGDETSFARLFGLHADRLHVFVKAKLGAALREKIEAEDVLQDAYVSALKSFDQFEYADEGAFLRWMCRIIDHRLRDAHDYFTADKRQAIPLARKALTGPSTALHRIEACQKVESALLQLSDEHRQVILLRYFEGLSAEETGEQMNRTAGAIRNLCARALVELGKHLPFEQESQA